MASKQFKEKLSLERFILDEDKSYVHLYLGDLKKTSSGRYIIPLSREYRLDLISYDIYGTVELKWVLMVINDIYSIGDLVYGLELKYPTVGSLINVLNVLNEYR